MCDLTNQEWEITVEAPQSQRSGQSLLRGHCMVLPFPWNQCTWYGCTVRNEQLVLPLRERLSFPDRWFKKKNVKCLLPLRRRIAMIILQPHHQKLKTVAKAITENIKRQHIWGPPSQI